MTYTLNAGCGGNAHYGFRDFQCDINGDIVKPNIKIRNLLIFDLNFLPFRNEIFSKVFLSHVIEHLSRPDVALKEVNRVSFRIVIIYPFFLHPDAYLDKSHKWIIIRKHFIKTPLLLHKLFSIQIIRKLYCKIIVETFDYPREITIEV